MYFRVKNNQEYLIGFTDLKVNDYVKFSYEGKTYSRCVFTRQAVQLHNKDTKIEFIMVYRLRPLACLVNEANVKFINVDVTEYDDKKNNIV